MNWIRKLIWLKYKPSKSADFNEEGSSESRSLRLLKIASPQNKHTSNHTSQCSVTARNRTMDFYQFIHVSHGGILGWEAQYGWGTFLAWLPNTGYDCCGGKAEFNLPELVKCSKHEASTCKHFPVTSRLFL